MSITFSNLTKIYGTQKAVNNISFKVKAGEIVGFLGPNGAGKSTTMKIATCYLPPTSGKVEVAGLDVVQHSLDVRRRTGYLPENNPLYTEMYVWEYLGFIGKLHKLKGNTLNSRIKEIIGLCGLQKEQNKKIEALSKGYRQRVGLAQALIHDPEVLILDEPTTGLDPNQIIEIRQLIKEVSKEKTVIFSTHIMQEVQQLCDRVVVINNGSIVADEPIATLQQRVKDQKVIIAEFSEHISTEELESIEGVMAVEAKDNNTYRIVSRGEADIRAAIFRLAAEKQLSLIGLKQEEFSMEQIFQELTERNDDKRTE